jgi:hypothetical protein
MHFYFHQWWLFCILIEATIVMLYKFTIFSLIYGMTACCGCTAVVLQRCCTAVSFYSTTWSLHAHCSATAADLRFQQLSVRVLLKRLRLQVVREYIAMELTVSQYLLDNNCAITTVADVSALALTADCNNCFKPFTEARTASQKQLPCGTVA